MIKINDFISYLPKQKEPLSAEVFFINYNNKTYIYDVGNGDCYVDVINQIENKYIILSHFHPDHIYNINKLTNYTLYQSKNTAKYTKIEEYKKELDEDIKIYEIPSSHAKGCLVLEYGHYLFVGDALYKSNKGLYNVNALNAQIKLLKNESIHYVIYSHREPLIRNKEDVLKELEYIYSKRNKTEPYIEV